MIILIIYDIFSSKMVLTSPHITPLGIQEDPTSNENVICKVD